MTLFYSRPPNLAPEFSERLKSECAWIRNKIEHIRANKLPKRPSAYVEIRDLERQYRQRELELAFKGPEWAKYEKYAMWEALTM
jgi:hypothetical protein